MAKKEFAEKAVPTPVVCQKSADGKQHNENARPWWKRDESFSCPRSGV